MPISGRSGTTPDGTRSSTCPSSRATVPTARALAKGARCQSRQRRARVFILGGGRQPGSGFDRVILFDVPRRDLLSLGQLQHASAGRFSYEPTYIVGNSYANPRISLANWKEGTTDTFSTAARGISQWKIGGSFNLYDASYLVNELLWDSYTFTTIPQVADNVGGGDVPANFPDFSSAPSSSPTRDTSPTNQPGPQIHRRESPGIGQRNHRLVFPQSPAICSWTARSTSTQLPSTPGRHF